MFKPTFLRKKHSAKTRTYKVLARVKTIAVVRPDLHAMKVEDKNKGQGIKLMQNISIVVGTRIPLRAGENMITTRMKRRIKRELSEEKPTVWVGKEGASSKTMNEILRQLKRREMVKIRILKSALREEEARDVASKIAQQTNSRLIEVRGHTLILYKPRERKKEE